MTMIQWAYSEYNTSGDFKNYNSSDCTGDITAGTGASLIKDTGENVTCETVISDNASYIYDYSGF